MARYGCLIYMCEMRVVGWVDPVLQTDSRALRDRWKEEAQIKVVRDDSGDEANDLRSMLQCRPAFVCDFSSNLYTEPRH